MSVRCVEWSCRSEASIVSRSCWHVCLLSRSYEAELNAEVERLKVGDRANAAAAAAADSAAASSADASAQAADSADSDATDSAAASASASAASADSATAATADDDDSSVTAAPILIEEVLEKSLALAVAAKVRGNTFYAHQQFPEAIAQYTAAIGHCPSGPESTAEEKEALAVFFSNRAAAFLMQQSYAECIEDCTASLELHPLSPKPLSRRSKAHEALEQYAQAIEDLKSLVALDPRDRESSLSLARLQKIENERNEKMKAEMMGKLKEFGNTILGKFGMSLDNFKATQDPTSGSYNISFGK